MERSEDNAGPLLHHELGLDPYLVVPGVTAPDDTAYDHRRARSLWATGRLRETDPGSDTRPPTLSPTDHERSGAGPPGRCPPRSAATTGCFGS